MIICPAIEKSSIRDHYERAHRLDMYERQRGLPLVLALAFEREA